MSKKINVGLVGFGLSGQCFHAPFISASENFNLLKVVERRENKSQKLYPHSKTVKDISDLYDDREIDLIVITTPTILHFDMAQKALLANKHVVVEKPFTMTSKEAHELIELAKKRDKMLSVYQNRRWDGDFLTVKSIINNKLLGKLVEYEAHFDRFRNNIRANAWQESVKSGGSILFDLGSHLIDQAQVLFGIPEQITADVRAQRKGSQIIDNFELIMGYDKLKVTLKAGMLVRGESPHFILYGTKGSFIKYGIDPQEDKLKQGISPLSKEWGTEAKKQWGTLNTQIKKLHFEGKVETISGAYAHYYDNIYEAITHKKELQVKPEEAKNTIRIIELALQSNRERRTVPFTF